jgi:hypothetical protein
MLMVDVRLSFKQAILFVASIAAPSGSTFFWMGFCMITCMGGSNHGAHSLDVGGMTGGIPNSF